ncbi:short repeat uncharacterized protein predicted to be involved in signal transduction [Streptomyces sp. SLBN-134]|nr:short repeat uncharacterized protein predicted to be involved in signal transduction [Streptomyces sp. SLBN-134]
MRRLGLVSPAPLVFLLCRGTSLATKEDLAVNVGYVLFPSNPIFESYNVVLSGGVVMRAVVVSVVITLVGTALSLLCGWPWRTGVTAGHGGGQAAACDGCGATATVRRRWQHDRSERPEASATHLLGKRRGAFPLRLHRVAPGAAAGNLAPALPLATPSLRRHGGHAALDDNTPEALRHFLEVGRYQVA